MLTRFVRIQLAIFAIVGIIGVVAMVLWYIQAPTLLGIGKMTVTLKLPTGGGLYRFSNVTYRGVQIGKVTAIGLNPGGAQATLALDTSPKIPADLQAQVRSISAVGEYYVELLPRTGSAPYLHDGSVIEDATIPQPIGPVLDQTSALINSIPKGKLGTLLDESYQAFNGAGFDFGSLFDSSSRISGDLNSVAAQARTLTEDTRPFLEAQAQTADSIRVWAHSLAGVTGQLVDDDPKIRTLLQKGPGAFDETSKLLEQIKPTLPVLLANLTTVGQILVAYHASLEQILVILPPETAAFQSFGGAKQTNGLAVGNFTFSISDPPACTVGFLPPSEWRSPSDTRVVDTPDGLYCKLPQDSPIGVRGARNYPCMERPGKRAPTVEICESDKPFVPLVMRQHVFGAYPLDPNLIAQGIMPDDRIGWNHDRIFGPVQGTPMPPGAVPRSVPAAPLPPLGTPAPMGPVPPIAPVDVPSAPTGPQRVASGGPAAHTGTSVAPSAFGSSRPGPSVAFVQYDPHTGRYVTPDGQVYRQADLVAPTGSNPGSPKAHKTWKDLFPT